jgi:hypothetical protein
VRDNEQIYPFTGMTLPMKQKSLTDGFEKYRKKTRKE